MIQVTKDHVPNDFTILVSGGVDSLAAAHWLKFHYRKDFSVIHFNHRYQPINDYMEYAVGEFCKEYDIGLTTYYNHKDNNLTECGLREWRIEMLNWLSRDNKSFITAHHLNDAVENYLANCFTGTPEHKPIQESTKFDNFTMFHPFLRTTKKDFIKYAEDNDVMQFVAWDPTNEETTQRRNWLRNVIIPEAEARNLGLETIVRKKFYDSKT